MSVQAISWSLGRAPKFAQQSVLFAVANYADEWGITYVGQERLSHDCKCRRATINDNLSLLEKCGLIARVKTHDPSGHRAVDHIVLAPLSTDRGSMQDAEKRAKKKHPQEACLLARLSTPSVQGQCTPDGRPSTRGVHEPLSEPFTTSTPKGVDSVKGTSVNRRKVTKREAELASAVLDSFNSKAGADFTLAGRALTCIVMRLREHPDLDADEHRRVIAAAFERAWWKGTPGPEVVYGNRTLFEKCVAEARRSPAKRSAYEWDGDAIEARAREQIEGGGR